MGARARICLGYSAYSTFCFVSSAWEKQMADLVIRNGTIVDGTGGVPYVGDVAIKDGLILAAGPSLSVKGAREVDATGKHVVPGWIDPHTHYDAQVMWDPMVSPSASNGVTTVVMGNCAVGIAPCPKPLRGFVTDLADAIEDIPADAINAVDNFWQVSGLQRHRRPIST